MFLRTLSSLLAIGAISAVSGCSSIEDEDWTNSGFGFGPILTSGEQNDIRSNAIGSAAVRSGLNADGAHAFGRISVTSPGTTPTPGSTVTFTGIYDVVGIENISVTGTSATSGFITGSNFTDLGTITLTGNFSTNRLTGDDGTLAVNGRVTGTSLSGTVTYDGQGGRLTGAVFDEGGVAAFHGNNDTRVFAGALTFEP